VTKNSDGHKKDSDVGEGFPRDSKLGAQRPAAHDSVLGRKKAQNRESSSSWSGPDDIEGRDVRGAKLAEIPTDTRERDALLANKQAPQKLRPPNLWLAMGGAAGLIGVIGLVLAAIPIFQAEREKAESANVNATLVWIQEEQLQVLNQIQTLQPGNSDISSSESANYERLLQLEGTLESLETEKQSVLPTEAPETETRNLAPNPSFEDGVGEFPDDWRPTTGGAAFSWGTEAHTGNRSICISRAGSKKSVEWGTTKLIPANPGEVYRLNIWAYGNSELEAYVLVGPISEDGNYMVGLGPGDWLPFNEETWTATESLVTIPADARGVQLFLGVNNSTETNSTARVICFDDIYFGIIDSADGLD
jgi:hypothetical protein